MSSGSIAGMTLGASDIIVEGNTVPMAVLESGEKNTNVLAIVLGICIPVVVLTIIGIIVCLYCKKKAANQLSVAEDQTNSIVINNSQEKVIIIR